MLDVDLRAWMRDAHAAAKAECGQAFGVSVQHSEFENGSATLDVDGDRVIGQLVVWQNGYTEVTVLDVATGDTACLETKRVADIAGLNAVLRRVLATVVRVDGQA